VSHAPVLRAHVIPRLRGLRRRVGDQRRSRRARQAQRRLERRMAGPKILRAFAQAYPEAVFVEIGANDGHQHDHLRPILDERGWSGVMVEPVPFVFERLRANYGGRGGIRLENVAVADRDGALPFYHLRQVADPEREGLPSWYDGIGSFSEETVRNHAALIPDLDERLVRVEVPCLTFDSLCARCELAWVDLLLLDTEGYDHEILASIDWSRHRPRLVVYEHYHMRSETRRSLEERLTGLGYECKSEGFDTWCLQTGVEDELTRRFRALAPAVPVSSAEEDR
jgi:FkbM family methyltransferase